MQLFKFVIIDAPGGSLIKGVALYDSTGERIGQVIAEAVEEPTHLKGLTVYPLKFFGEDRRVGR